MNGKTIRLASKSILATFVLTVFSAGAETYQWANITAGNWCANTSWEYYSSSAPVTTPGEFPGHTGSGDTARYRYWTKNVVTTLDDDVMLDTLIVDNGYGGTLDLNDHALTLLQGNNGKGLVVNLQGAPAAVRSLNPTYAFTFANGTLKLGHSSANVSSVLGTTATGSGAGSSTLIFSDVDLNDGFGEWWGSSRVILRDGSVWTPDRNQQVGNNYWRKDNASQYSLLCAQGSGTRIDSTDYDLNIRSYKNQFYLQDGAVATFRDLLIGGTFRSTNCLASVENGLLTVNETLHLGSDAINKSTAGDYASDVNLSRESTLHIEGANALVTAGTLAVYAKTAAALEVVLPKTGFVDANGDPHAPISVGALTLVARNAEYEDMGPTRFNVTSRDWCNRHSETTVTLLSFTTADEAAVNELLGNVVLTDYTPEEIAAGQAPVVALGEDGKSIVLTSPFAQVDPTFEACAESGTTVGTKTIRVTPTSYGTVSSSITSILVEWADNQSFTDAKSVEMLTEPLTGALPKTLRQDITDDFVARQRYYARVTVTTDESLTSAKTFWFDGNDGASETYTWNDANGSVWQQGSSWGKDVSNDFPRGEDVVKFSYIAGSRTVSLSEDAELYHLDGSGKYPAIQYGTTYFDLNGHTLKFTARYDQYNQALSLGGGGTPKDDCEPIGVTVVFRNGHVELPDPQVQYRIASSVQIGSYTAAGNGTLVLDEGASMIADIRYLCNSSRLLVKGGSSWRPVKLGLTMCTHTALSPYSVVCVTGACSRIDHSQYNFTVCGDRASLCVLDGGRVEAKNLKLGGTPSINFAGSSVASERTRIVVDGGTVATVEDLKIGWDDDSDVMLSPRLVIAGTEGRVSVGGNLEIREKMDAEIEFALPEEGYAETPLVANGFTSLARGSDKTDFGPTHMRLSGVRAWAKKHPKATTDLISLATPNASALEALKASVVSDWRQVDASALAVSADGKKLSLTAPEIPGMLLIVR